MSGARRIVIVTPAHDEASSLPELHARLAAALEGVEWRWLLVDDASDDACFAVAEALAASDPRVAAIRLAERSGAHAAVLAGLRVVAVDPAVGAVVIMACDLQDPPEVLPGLIAASLAGADVVWAVRRARPGTSLGRRAAARFVHALPRAVLGATFYPAGGADMGLVAGPSSMRSSGWERFRATCSSGLRACGCRPALSLSRRLRADPAKAAGVLSCSPS